MRYNGEREGLNDELRKKAANCKTPEELLELAKKEGYKLTQEELTAVAGGAEDTDKWSTCTTYDPWYKHSQN